MAFDHTPSGGVSHGARGSAPKAAALAAFTLLEMLTVISIIGIIAALTVPVLKNFGKSDVSISASRQLLDDIGRARQLAMSQRTTVYMVFVPTNFWVPSPNVMFTEPPMTPAQTNVATSLLGMQLTGYTFMAYGAIGDQPGQHQWHYLAPWQTLPDGSFIPLWKFYNPGGTATVPYFQFSDPVNSSAYFQINAFTTNFTFPFPTQDASNNLVTLPYIAFNYLGQLSTSSGQLFAPNPPAGIGDQDYTGAGIDIPLAQGSLVTAKDPTTRSLQIGPPQVIDNPPGNATNISYNVVHIDPLTGRATLLYHKLQ
ncbi:MAG TPA: prepilin-type N-terminal cleavage/methylation domain-containing protein [Pseudomonadales bacterium]|nr:prepilin-type N-terminal cleavage/methylation domain-containing protein [Pseudomonadales bacterium]